MKYLAKLFAGFVLAMGLAACTPQTTDEVAETAPTETADEFVARIHSEFLDVAMEAEIADWVYATYINDDTAYLVSAAKQRFAA